MKPQTLRIIGGRWRGRKLPFATADGLRPTGDRIRETLFNWLAPQIHGARCLDLFAGSAALGLESLSRGAAYTLMLERNKTAAAQIRANLALLQAETGQLLEADALAHLARGNPGEAFDTVFLDPPFDADLWQASIDALNNGNWLSSDAIVYIESGRQPDYRVPDHWTLHREKTAGRVCYRLYCAQPMS